MARPRKRGLDYFPFDVTFFSDKKVRILKSRFGADGIEIYIYLLCEIYKEGYFIHLDNDYEYIIADELGMSSEKVMQVVKFLLERSLLDSKLFQSDTIITSRGIQRRFQEAVKSRASKSNVEVEPRYWLLAEEDTQPFTKFTQNADCSEKKPSYSENNADLSEKKDTKKSKEKKSKENISCTTEPCETESLEAFYDSIWNLYPIKKGKGQVSRTRKQVLQRIGYNQMKRCVERFVKDMESEHRDRKYWMHGSTFFNSGYVDYLDKNYMQSGIESIPPVEKRVDPEDEELVGDDW